MSTTTSQHPCPAPDCGTAPAIWDSWTVQSYPSIPSQQLNAWSSGKTTKVPDLAPSTAALLRECSPPASVRAEFRTARSASCVRPSPFPELASGTDAEVFSTHSSEESRPLAELSVADDEDDVADDFMAEDEDLFLTEFADPNVTAAAAAASKGHFTIAPTARAPVKARNVYIACLPGDFTDATLQAMLSPFGNVLSCRVFSSALVPNSGKAYGFSLFERPDEALRAVEVLNGMQIANVKLQAKLSRDCVVRKPRVFKTRASDVAPVVHVPLPAATPTMGAPSVITSMTSDVPQTVTPSAANAPAPPPLHHTHEQLQQLQLQQYQQHLANYYSGITGQPEPTPQQFALPPPSGVPAYGPPAVPHPYGYAAAQAAAYAASAPHLHYLPQHPQPHPSAYGFGYAPPPPPPAQQAPQLPYPYYGAAPPPPAAYAPAAFHPSANPYYQLDAAYCAAVAHQQQQQYYYGYPAAGALAYAPHMNPPSSAMMAPMNTAVHPAYAHCAPHYAVQQPPPQHPHYAPSAAPPAAGSAYYASPAFYVPAM